MSNWYLCIDPVNNRFWVKSITESSCFCIEENSRTGEYQNTNTLQQKGFRLVGTLYINEEEQAEKIYKEITA